MTKAEVIQAIKKEIESTNKAIDKKIIKGQEYHKEARQHLLLLNELDKIQGNVPEHRII